jgi:predicted DCC family thiol-disulfide oxidoreductase YuxK
MINEPVILFDGVCNFCNSSVQFIIKRDPKGLCRFASLQSDIGQAYLSKYNLGDYADSFVLIEKDRVYLKSDAALQITKNLAGAWKVFYILKIVPRPLRDLVYSFIAKNRYKWFGKKAACMIPTPDIKSRFID